MIIARPPGEYRVVRDADSARASDERSLVRYPTPSEGSWCQRPTGLDNPRLPSSPALAAVHSSRGSGGMPRIDDELHIAVEEVEEADKLAETLPRVGRIEQPI